MIKSSFISEYYRLSRNILYSIIFIFPIYIIHQAINLYFELFTNIVIIKSAEKSFRSIFDVFGIYNFLAYFIFSTLLVLSIIIYNFSLFKDQLIQFKILFIMIIESALWALVLLLFLSCELLLSIIGVSIDNVLYKLNICFGAGFWEELLFRLFLISFIILIFNKMFRIDLFITVIIAILISSVIFSLFHFEAFEINSIYNPLFLKRFLGGVFLGTLYIVRGLGISIYCHIFYDIIIFFDLASFM